MMAQPLHLGGILLVNAFQLAVLNIKAFTDLDLGDKNVIFFELEVILR